MTIPFTVLLPTVTFDLGNYNVPEWFVAGRQSSQQVKQAYDPFEIAPAFDMPAEPMELLRFVVWQQTPWQNPAGYLGDTLFLLDAGGRYCDAAFYPEREDVAPEGTDDLGAVVLRAGGGHGLSTFGFDPPWVVERGDLIVVAPQAGQQGAAPVDVDLWPRAVLRAPGGGPARKAGIVDHWPLGHSVRNNPVASLRSVIKGIKHGGTEIRVALQASQFDSILSRVEIGKWSGVGADMSAAPAPLMVNSVTNIVVPNRKTVWTDWTPFSTSAGDSLVINVNNTQGARAWRCHPHLETWVSTTPSDGMAALQGTSIHLPGFRYCVAAVQVR